MPRPIVLVSGSTGMIGAALTTVLDREGYVVRRLVRGAVRGENEFLWDPAAGTIDPQACDAVTAVVHLAGENVGHRWTRPRKARILASRVQGTTLIARTLAGQQGPPSVLISASAVGFYGDRGDQLLDESSVPGTGFLADVCREWEGAAAKARRAATRVVTIRTGVVLSRSGGALARMLLPFRLGVGGRLGSGRQWMSWITLDDHVLAILHAIRTPSLDGPVNCTAPVPVTNREFTRALANSLHRWAILPVPSLALQLLFGQMADETLLASQRALPIRLTETGFVFTASTIEAGLSTALR